MEKKRLTAEDTLNEWSTDTTTKGRVKFIDAIKAMQEFASRESSELVAKNAECTALLLDSVSKQQYVEALSRIKELEEALREIDILPRVVTENDRIGAIIEKALSTKPETK